MTKFLALASVCAFALATAACTPGAVANDVAVLDAAVAKDAADVLAYKADPNTQLAEALVADASALATDIAQLKADLGTGQVPQKVARALDDASRLAANLKTATPATSAGLVAEAAALEKTANAIHFAG